MNQSRILIDRRSLILPILKARLRKPLRGGFGWGDDLGAIIGSGLYCKVWIDAMDATQLAIDLDLETHKGALFTNAITNDFTNDTAYAAAPYNANETSGAGWAAGGVVLTTTVYTEAVAGKAVFDAADVSNANSTLAAAEYYLLYADALADQAIVGVDFTAPVSCTAGLFEILWTAPAAGGIFNIDLTP
jgi:hypothetical protein